jgi:co-chaperonin GroES (HSP10)
MKMLHNNVLLTEAEQSTTTAGGIILTADIDKAVKPGVVLSVSESVASILPELVVGAEVYLDWKESMPVTIDGQKAAIVDAKNIKCVI